MVKNSKIVCLGVRACKEYQLLLDYRSYDCSMLNQIRSLFSEGEFDLSPIESVVNDQNVFFFNLKNRLRTKEERLTLFEKLRDWTSLSSEYYEEKKNPREGLKALIAKLDHSEQQVLCAWELSKVTPFGPNSTRAFSASIKTNPSIRQEAQKVVTMINEMLKPPMTKPLAA